MNDFLCKSDRYISFLKILTLDFPLGAIQKGSTFNKLSIMRVKSKEGKRQKKWLQRAEVKTPENILLYR